MESLLLITGILAFAIIRYFIYRKSSRDYIGKMLTIADLVEEGVEKRFVENLKPQYGQEKAALFATSLTNEIFSKTPNPLTSHSPISEEIMAKELAKIQEDSHLCRLISEAVTIRCANYYVKGQRKDSYVVDPIENLKKLKIYEELIRPPRLKEFKSSATLYFHKK